MKRVLTLLLSAALMTAALTGCSSGEEDALVSKTPFPEFFEVDIEGEEISQAIVRMEEISFQIFAYVCDHPNKVGQIRKFMNYYLPTTIKLLNS